MKLSTQVLKQSGWSDPDSAKQVFDALGKMGVSGHYAELAIKHGPDAVATLVEFRAEKDATSADKARALIRAGAAREYRAPTIESAKNAWRFKMDVLSNMVAVGESAEVEPVLFYGKDNENGQFSNFAPFPFTVTLPDGEKIDSPTAEHFFQAMKFWTSAEDYGRKILAAKTPGESAKMGRNRDKPMRKDWESIKDDVMRVAVASKVSQNHELVDLLLGTGAAPLIEHAPLDGYWGDAFELGGIGKNMLGKILEEVRGAMREDRLDAYLDGAMKFVSA